MPVPLRASAARLLSPFFNVRGVYGLASRLAGDAGDFEARRDGIVFAGTLSSFIDKQVFLLGSYEGSFIDLFLSRVAAGGVAMDVGANVGNHSLRFARHFDRVLAFEPSPQVLPALRRNIALNPDLRIDLHPIGLSDRSGELDFHTIENGNLGLGTFSTVEQYDKPLQKIATARVELGDAVVGDTVIRAIKVDVQGFEPQVLKGLRRTLERDRPIVWSELGAGTDLHVRADVAALFPYPVTIERFLPGIGGRPARLERVAEEALVTGDYLVSAAD